MTERTKLEKKLFYIASILLLSIFLLWQRISYVNGVGLK